MIELQLIGYTEDAEHLVLDDDLDGDGRYTVRVDPELLAAVALVRAERAAQGLPVDERPAEDRPADEPSVDERPADEPPVVAPAGPAPVATRPVDEVLEPAATNGHHPVPVAALTPAEIQAQLRAGRSVRAVAEDAGTDVAWIERWLPPIAAERERVLAEAWRRRLDVAGAEPLGDSVARALRDRGVTEDRTTWTAARRANGRWRVSVRFVEDGRARSATWTMDPSDDQVRPASALAGELAAPRPRTTRRRAARRR